MTTWALKSVAMVHSIANVISTVSGEIAAFVHHVTKEIHVAVIRCDTSRLEDREVGQMSDHQKGRALGGTFI